ncbi:hypothetical protein [Alistipes sp. ZOR0009]|jgi:hypothetical protein|uniref:hypothetical protein n=1 Tax=Alistipes sp. ZOR0009 TaxID=1339253 RepID=UPI000647DF9B|nr:hypothetical protein [Alistipes sp. ZOR0009]
MNKPLFNPRFLDDDFENVLKELTALEALTKGKLDSFTPAERRRYGKTGNSTMEWASRILEYMDQNNDFVPYLLDKEEYRRKIELHKGMRPIINRLRALLENWEDTEMMIKFDIDSSARSYYQNIKMLASKNAPHAQTIFDDLSTRYANLGRKEITEEPKESTKN